MFARTDRLLLRPGWIEDAPLLASALCRDAPGVIPADRHPRCLDRARALLARPTDPARRQLLIMRRGAGRMDLVGGIGLSGRGATARLDCRIRADCRDRGYATEATQAVMAIAAALGIDRLTARGDTGRAAAVLGKLGFQPCGGGMMSRPVTADRDGPVRRLAA